MSENTPAEQAASNSLGLDLEALKIKDDPEPTTTAVDPVQDVSQQEDGAEATGEDVAQSPTGGKTEPREKKKPYVNPDRVKTGGTQRDKLSQEELEERMIRIREQNAKINQRRRDVEADEEEYKKTQEAERAKNARARKVQEGIDKAREQNALRKMNKIQSREWDSGKPAPRHGDSSWKFKNTEATEDREKKPFVGIRGAVRGGGRGGGRGRGRGGGSATSPTSENPTPAREKDVAPPATAKATP